jgi:hypothetical protein
MNVLVREAHLNDTAAIVGILNPIIEAGVYAAHSRCRTFIYR